MKRMLLLALAILALAPTAGVADEWRSEQPPGPGIGVPVPLGAVGDIEFQAPNRGMLITAGNDAIPAGLYAFDGTGWYQYSTVCGGHAGRIAWAGPDDFWTISDQQKGQQTGVPPAQRVSLCHFVNGQVVASYAKPIGVADSYPSLNAAACLAPNDCWFAGARLPGTVNTGAFHLHWDGQALTEVPSLTEEQVELADPGRNVTDLAVDEDENHIRRLYESVRVEAADEALAEGSEPSLVHEIAPAASQPFVPLFASSPISFGAGGGPTQLEGFRLADAGEGLWALAGATGAKASPIVLRLDAGEGKLSQVPVSDPGGLLGASTRINGVAADPGADSLWVSVQSGESSVAHLARIHADGAVDSAVALPAEGIGLDPKGPAGPIACPAHEQCWMATASGWLFHLGPDLEKNSDPAFHVLVTSRPRDESLPVEPPDSLPVDDSGVDEGRSEGEESPPLHFGAPPVHRALVAGIRSHVIGRNVLEMTFLLRAKAHVRLVAERKGHVVAKTKLFTMAKGRHSLHLRLNPKRWPTKLDLQAHPVRTRGSR